MDAELIIDNFAGGGGASTGIEMALGRSPDIAINHDEEALAMHAANHPETIHLREDIFAVDPVQAVAGRPVGLAWFSPDCKHFSKAKGGKPKSKKIRGLAWVAVKWAATVRPRVIILENVEEFKTWGPLRPDGSPCPDRKGKTFRSFLRRLHDLGYTTEHRELRACDYGAPTIRRRFFLIARCDGRPIVWPQPTHGDPRSAAVQAGELPAWRTAAECIDFSLPCPSIFERTRPLAEATLRRIARGIWRYVLTSADPFIVRNIHGNGPVGIDNPLPTLLTGNHTYLATPFLTEHANGSSQRNFNLKDPLRTQCAEVKGGHFALASAFLAKHYGDKGQRPGSDLADPVSTVTAVDHHSLVAAHLVNTANGKTTGRAPNHWPAEEPLRTITTAPGFAVAASHLSKLYGTTTGQDAREPMHTVTGGGNHIGEVRAFLVKYYGNEKEGVPMTDPMHTIPTRDRFGLVTVAGVDYCIADIGMRMLTPRELFRAQGFPATYIIDPPERPLTKTAQVRMCGNSVCPPIAAALVAANCPDLRAMKEAA